MTLEEFLARTIDVPSDDARRNRHYLQQLPVAQELPELREMGVPVDGPKTLLAALGDELDERTLVTCSLFCGAANVHTSLHFDRGDFARAAADSSHLDATSSVDNLFLQQSGRKLVRLLRPADHDKMYPLSLIHI